MSPIHYQTLSPYAIKSVSFVHSSVGLGSTLISLLGLADFCERNQIDLAFDTRGILSTYVDGNENPWNYLFTSGAFNIKFGHNRKIAVRVGMPTNPFFDYMMCCDEKTLFISDEWQAKFASMISRHLKFSYHMQSIINDDIKLYDVSDAIGTHIRGTDHSNHGKALSIQERLNQVEEEMKRAGTTKVFVMTDEKDYLTAATNRFGDRIVYLNGIDRSATQMPLHHNRNQPNGAKILVDLIREIMVLSRCKTQVLPRSAVSALARCFNPTSQYRLLDEDLSSHDLTKWKNSPYMNCHVEIQSLP
jgi:hypothetical protein